MTRLRNALAPLVLTAACATGAAAADAAHPTVIELFQSQGCSSCPPANANVMALADRPEILALSFQVTYWDQLGWKDTFAQPAFTARQWRYARDFGHASVFTPQVVINGRRDGVGANLAELRALIAAGDRGDGGPAIAFGHGQVRVGAERAQAGGAEVWLVRYDPRTELVPIKRGENAGRVLPHRDVVRQLVLLGRWTGGAQSYGLPAPMRGMATAILVQAASSGAILAAARGHG